jgi:MFS transporter, PPP family, 3-phenylpropionic acid transporter
MLVLKALYFFGSAAFAAQYLYTSLFYFTYFKLSKEQIGLLSSVAPFISLFSIPITIHYSKNLKWTAICVTLLGTLIWAIHFIVPVSNPVFWVLGIIIGTSLTMSSIGTILDSLTLELLTDQSLYGQQRLFGSISWGFSSFVTGLGMEWKGLWAPFYIFFAFIGVFFGLLCILPRPLPKEEETAEESTALGSEEQVIEATEETPLVSSGTETPVTLWEVLWKPKPIFFFISISLLGLVFAVLGQYLFIYLSTTWKASPTLIGSTTPFSIAMEVPTFYFSGLLLDKYGKVNMVIAAHILMLLRLALYIFLPSVVPIPNGNWVMMFVETLHGASFGLQWAAGMAFLDEMAPKHLRQTFVGIFCSLSNNAGGILGNVIGGLVYERYNYIGLWGVCGIITFLSLLSFLIATKF